MNSNSCIKTWKYLFFLIFFLFIVSLTSIVSAQTGHTQTDKGLAEKYAPVLYFHRDELFRPQSVDVMVQAARLRQDIKFWFDVNILNEVTIQDLITYNDPDYTLDLWYGDPELSDYKNYSAHEAYYDTFLSPEAGGPPITTYAHVVRNNSLGKISIQYWLFYYYNDYVNIHEGDWEVVQVVLNENEEPESVIFSQHLGGTKRTWEDTQVEDGTHPAVYVALGSHANYFWGDEVYPEGGKVGNVSVWVSDRTGTYGRVIPKVILIPERKYLETSSEDWSETEWLFFSGHWGELAIQGNFGGPSGPADKGDQWEKPFDWGEDQPFDLEKWFHNRLRVEVKEKPFKLGISQVTLRTSSGIDLPAYESASTIALLHGNPPTDSQIIADIKVPSNLPFNLIATWPDVEESQVIHYYFEEIPLIPSGIAKLTFNLDGSPVLELPDGSNPIHPTRLTTEPATWESLEPVWFSGQLPAIEVTKGIIIGLTAAILPTLVYTSIIYWSDRYEKEPRSLLTTAFVWGAIPAVLITILIEIFFNLPSNLLSQQAFMTIRSGIVIPFVEELIKGLAILYIARRYRREFDNVLDGIIYGAMVGFGFAMTGNLINFLGTFLLKGFFELNWIILIEGILFGFNQGLYSAFFGAGLGLARLTRNRTYRWVIPLISLAVAITINSLHNLAIQNVLGFNLFFFLLPWVGLLVIVVIIAWSLGKQKQILVNELVDEIPENLYKTIIHRRIRNKTLQLTFYRKGLQEWKKLRHLYQLCAELAFKKMQGYRFPEEKGIDAEIKKLRREIFELIEFSPNEYYD